MTLSIIVAMTDERVIGRNNQLPWRLSEDLVRFKQLTMGHPIIMGRKTFESIGKPLPGRTNIVVTRDPQKSWEGTVSARSLDEALRKAGPGEVFVIGGAALFEAALPLADKLYLTLIHEAIPGDVYFPKFDLKKRFDIIEETRQRGVKSDKLDFSFVTAVKSKKHSEK